MTLPSALEWGVHWLCKLGWKDASAMSSEACILKTRLGCAS